ncbi:MAG TPA: glycosyltransferase family 4 protein [Solirubrobacteraceae bacterium]|nr:glycosyltransferase family 4 protein [Solirubrobacteraceae bacterium]
MSSCPEKWGGSEELWWQAALALRERGHRVDVLKTNVDDAHPRIRDLRAAGCSVRDLDRARTYRASAAASSLLPARHGLDKKRRDLLAAAVALAARRPHLAIVTQGQNFDGAHLGLLCDWLRIPYVMVAQKASELHWPADWARPHLGRVFAAARRCVFVSEHNKRLTEHQIGAPIERALIIRNPVLVDRDAPLPWPASGNGNGDGPLRLACVARLFPAEKGQDLLLDALARDRWRARPVRVGFFGEGANRDGLAGMARTLGLDNVSFEGQAPRIVDVWRTHHALVLPSRAEGLPLSVVEAMACGRVPVVTDVGGTAEVVEDGVSGFVAPAPTVAAVDDALERAWAARDDWPAIGRTAASRIGELVPRDGGGELADLALSEAAGAGRRAARGA